MAEQGKITSLQNQIVKEVVKLHQNKNAQSEGLMILEGEKLIDAALHANIKFKYIFSTTAQDGAIEVSADVMKKMATTDSEPKILAVAHVPKYNSNAQFKRAILLSDIKDAGNLGTIIRSASAFNFDTILLHGDFVNPYCPKVLRASVGEIFKVKIGIVNNDELKKLKKTHKIVGTLVNSNNKIVDIKPSSPFILAFGSEAKGLSDDIIKLCDETFTLAMKQGVESLNLAVCASICMWEINKNA